MRLDVSAADRGILRDHASIYQRVEQLDSEATARPAVEPVVDRREWSVVGWAVAPTAANLHRVHDAGDHPPFVNPPRARLGLRQMRLDRYSRFIRQPEQRPASLLLIHAPVNQENQPPPEEADWFSILLEELGF